MIANPELKAAKALVRADKRERAKESKAEKLARARTLLAVVTEGQRQPRDLDNGFLAYLRRQPCEARHMGDCDGPIEAAHIRYSDFAAGNTNPGTGRKSSDRFANPLCHFHHQHDQHKRKERRFWEGLGKDAYETAAAHYGRYKA